MSRDLGVTVALREVLPSWAVDLFVLLSLPGDLLLIVPILGLLYLGDVFQSLRRPVESEPLCSDGTVALIATIFGGLALVVLLETLFAAPRPPESLHAVDASEFAFPSGHTMAATVLWGSLVLWSSRGQFRTRVGVAALIIGLVAFSRLALGVHYLPDVLAGIGFGAVYVATMFQIPDREPRYTFAVATVIAVLAVIVTVANSRALLALGGTVGAAVGWQLVETEPVKRTIVRVFPKAESN